MIAWRTASDLGQLRMRALARLMPNAWTVSIDWRVDDRMIANLLCGEEIFLGA